jgi:hypothetical protein
VEAGYDTPFVHVYADDPFSCDGPSIQGLYRSGAELSITQFYERQSGQCEGPFAIDLPMHELTPVSRTELVPLERVVDPGPQRIVERSLNGSDGLRFPEGVFDRQLGAACSFRRTTTTAAQCVPDDRSPAFSFEDAACTKPATWNNPRSCPSPWFVQLALQCPSDPLSIHAPTDVLDGLYTKPTLGSCVAENLTALQIPYRLGPELALEATSRGPAAGSARIVPIMHQSSSGSFADRLWFFDQQLGIECAVDPVIDRCVPATKNLQHGYSDPTCQTPLIVFDEDRPSGCAVPEPGAYVRGYEFVRVLGPYTGKFYLATNQCVEIPVPPSQARFSAVAVSASVFEQGTSVIEP